MSIRGSISGVIKTWSWVMLAIAIVALAGCMQPPAQPLREKKEGPLSSPPSSPAVEADNRKSLPAQPPPRPVEINEAVKRIFKAAVTVDTTSHPSFLVGDYNGDFSQDLAVIVKPVPGRLSEINQEYPPWMLTDPFHPNLPPQLRKEPLRVEGGDVLLAIIHGYGSQGWRNPEATQTYLLKGAVRAKLSTQPGSGKGVTRHNQKLPKLFGDTILQTWEETEGFYYYTGASYAWYHPKTFKPEALRGVAHAGLTVPNQDQAGKSGQKD